jgi:hypothetical protein
MATQRTANRDSCIVEQEVQSTGATYRLLDDVLDGGKIADISVRCRCFSAAGTNFSGYFLRDVDLPVDETNFAAAAGELLTECPADPGRATCDNGTRSLKHTQRSVWRSSTVADRRASILIFSPHGTKASFPRV